MHALASDLIAAQPPLAPRYCGVPPTPDHNPEGTVPVEDAASPAARVRAALAALGVDESGRGRLEGVYPSSTAAQRPGILDYHAAYSSGEGFMGRVSGMCLHPSGNTPYMHSVVCCVDTRAVAAARINAVCCVPLRRRSCGLWAAWLSWVERGRSRVRREASILGCVQSSNHVLLAGMITITWLVWLYTYHHHSQAM